MDIRTTKHLIFAFKHVHFIKYIPNSTPNCFGALSHRYRMEQLMQPCPNFEDISLCLRFYTIKQFMHLTPVFCQLCQIIFTDFQFFPGRKTARPNKLSVSNKRKIILYFCNEKL